MEAIFMMFIKNFLTKLPIYLGILMFQTSLLLSPETPPITQVIHNINETSSNTSLRTIAVRNNRDQLFDYLGLPFPDSIKKCSIEVNGILIKPNELASVPVINNTLDITLSFDQEFSFEPLQNIQVEGALRISAFFINLGIKIQQFAAYLSGTHSKTSVSFSHIVGKKRKAIAIGKIIQQKMVIWRKNQPYMRVRNHGLLGTNVNIEEKITEDISE